jgi:hypothetical protein
MSLLLLFQPNVNGPLNPAIVIPNYLRIDDTALIEFVKDELLKKVNHVDVIDGYPESETASVPSIAIEHSQTSHKPTELASYLDNHSRRYNVDIMARSKGERDDLINCMEKLVGKEMTTSDDRVNAIVEVTSVGNINRQTDMPIPTHGNYYYVDFDGSTSYGTVPHDNEFVTNSLSIDMDVFLQTLPSSGLESYIFDKYNVADGRGYRFYVDSSGTLFYKLGVGPADFTLSVDFNQYVGTRVQLSATADYNGTRMRMCLFINGTLVSDESFFWFLSVNTGNKDITIGALDDLVLGSKTSYADMHLYALRISDTLDETFGMSGEYLIPDNDNDLINLHINEGNLDIAYDKSYGIVRNLTLYPADSTTWVRYKRDESLINNLGDTGVVRQHVLEFLVKGLIRDS